MSHNQEQDKNKYTHTIRKRDERPLLPDARLEATQHSASDGTAATGLTRLTRAESITLLVHV
jgi:hypothetical protein